MKYIKKILKIIIALFFKIIDFFFPSKKKINNKKDIINKEEVVTKKTVMTGDTSSLPDTDNIKGTSSDDTYQETVKELKLYNNDEQVIKNDDNVKLPLTDQEFDDLWKEVMEENFDVELKYVKRSLEIEINKLRARVWPVFIKKIIYFDLYRRPSIKERLIKEINKDLEKEPIKELKRRVKEIDKKDDKRIDKPIEDSLISKDIYTIVTPVKEELNFKEVPKINNNNNYIVMSNKKKDDIKAYLEDNSYIMVPLVEEIPKVSLKEEVKNIVKATTTIVGTTLVEAADYMLHEQSTEIKEIRTETNLDSKEVKTEPNLDSKEVTTEPILDSEKIKVPELITSPIEEVKTIVEEPTIKEEITSPIIEKTTEVKTEVVKELPIIEEIHLEIKKVDDKLEQQIVKEHNKEDIEDKNYDYIEKEIDKYLRELEHILYQNEDKLTKEQKDKITKEKERLRDIKDNIEVYKEKDLDIEEERLYMDITKDDIKDLKKEISKIHVEHQVDLNNNLINRVEDLDNLSIKDANEIERRLIKTKLRRAFLLAEIPSLLALPFFRNRYFHMFTTGLLINNHLGFINQTITHRTNGLTTPDLEEIKQGKDALNSSIGITYDNLLYIDNLNNQILVKHPELIHDSSYQLYINNIRNNLNKSYNKLMKKRDVLDKVERRTKKSKKVLRKIKKRVIGDSNSN